MALKGKSTHDPIPYIPEAERSSDQPTIFWIVPKNMKGTYQSLERFSKGANMSGKGQRTINPEKMAQADVEDFLTFCKKVENYSFGPDFSDLENKGVISIIEDENTLRLMYVDLDPTIFQEIQNASANWEMLGQGEESYKTWKEFVKGRKK